MCETATHFYLIFSIKYEVEAFWFGVGFLFVCLSACLFALLFLANGYAISKQYLFAQKTSFFHWITFPHLSKVDWPVVSLALRACWGPLSKE